MRKMSMNAVRAMRAYSDAMQPAVTTIKESCDELLKVCTSLEDSLGPRAGDYLKVILAILGFVEQSTEPILHLSQQLKEDANEIEHFCIVNGSGNPT